MDIPGGERTIIRGATAMVIHDPLHNKVALVVFDKDGGCIMQTDLYNPANLRAVTMKDLKDYFKGPAMAADKVIATRVLEELNRITSQ